MIHIDYYFWCIFDIVTILIETVFLGEKKSFGVNLLMLSSLYEEKHRKPLTIPQTL